MEVLVESPSRSSSSTMDNFDLRGIMVSPYLSAPSSPKRFGEYYSEFYQEFDYFSSSSSIPFEAPTNNVDEDDGGDGFAFYFNRESNTSSRSAEELFDGGRIKPLKPEGNEMFTSHKTKLEGLGKDVSPKKKKESRYGDPSGSETEQRGRGRDRTPASVLSSSNSGRRVTRSHSPYRISKYMWEEVQHPQQQQRQQQQQPRSNKEESTLTSSSNSRASSSSSKGSKRWRLRDILLFRSVSEGRGTSKDSYKKYSVGYKKPEEVNASKKKGPVSAHEYHYAMKKAESEDLKKRTFLPYKQGILGRLAGFGF